jgi:hypothetical protein
MKPIGRERAGHGEEDDLVKRRQRVRISDRPYELLCLASNTCNLL